MKKLFSLVVVCIFVCTFIFFAFSGCAPQSTSYMVSYVLNGGENNPLNISTIQSGNEFVLKDPTKDGADFLGWYNDAEFTDKILTIKGKNEYTLYAKWDNYTVLFGIFEPLTSSQVKEFNIDKTIALMQAVGVRSLRLSFENNILNNILNPSADIDDITIRFRQAEIFSDILVKLKNAGVKLIIGNGVLYPRVNSTKGAKDWNVVPHPSDSEYLLFLQKFERIWFLLSQQFPEVELWEVGNESNHNPFLHPLTYVENSVLDQDPTMNANLTGFSMKEKAQITVDLMYYATKGVKKGNSKASVVMPGLAPVGGLSTTTNAMKDFLNEIYLVIKSQHAPSVLAPTYFHSSNPNDYFENIAWHPYYKREYDPNWIIANDNIYKVMQENGDGDKGVYFTEMGLTNGVGGDEADALEAENLKKYITATLNDLPYVKTFHVFRLYECSAALAWGGKGEVYYGLFKEPTDNLGFSPKKKAFAVQEVFGGKGDLRMYE